MSDLADLHEAVGRAKSARKKIDTVLMREICDSRADVPLIQLRKAIREIEIIVWRLHKKARSTGII